MKNNDFKFKAIIDFLIFHRETMHTYNRRELCAWYDRAIQFGKDNAEFQKDFDSCLWETMYPLEGYSTYSEGKCFEDCTLKDFI